MVAKASSSSSPGALWAAFEALPQGVKGESIKGSLSTQPRPLSRHQDIGGSIRGELRSVYQRGRGGPGGWWSLPEPAFVSRKRGPFYADVGVGWLWYVDPERTTLSVSRVERGRWVEMGICSGAGKSNAPPFDAVEFVLAELWADRLPD